MYKSLINTLKILGIALLFLSAGIIPLIFFTGPKLPDDTDAVIEKVLNSELPELVKGQSGYAVSDGYKIWYESVAPEGPNKGAILLLMGMATDALGWPQPFIDALTGAGYQVIRFDYRGTGMTDWVEDWQQKSYTLADLAGDAAAILDVLHIEKAHLVGLSMGGMIAQEFAVAHADRTLTLTSIMSSGDIFDKELPQVPKRFAFDALKIGIKYGLFPSERNSIKLLLALRTILRGEARYDIDVKRTAERVLYDIRKRKGYNPNAAGQHGVAVERSPSRYEKLKDLTIPVLIIHGMNDPLVPIEHSRKLAAVIPHAKTKWLDNLGHDLPASLAGPVAKVIVSHIDENNAFSYGASESGMIINKESE